MHPIINKWVKHIYIPYHIILGLYHLSQTSLSQWTPMWKLLVRIIRRTQPRINILEAALERRPCSTNMFIHFWKSTRIFHSQHIQYFEFQEKMFPRRRIQKHDHITLYSTQLISTGLRPTEKNTVGIHKYVWMSMMNLIKLYYYYIIVNVLNILCEGYHNKSTDKQKHLKHRREFSPHDKWPLHVRRFVSPDIMFRPAMSSIHEVLPEASVGDWRRNCLLGCYYYIVRTERWRRNFRSRSDLVT